MFFSCKSSKLWLTIWSSLLLVFALTFAGISGQALAVHDDGIFELDTRAGVEGDQDKQNDPIPPVVDGANTVNNGNGDDWADIYLDFLNPGAPVPHSNAEVLSFVEDTFANNNIDNGAMPFVFARTPEVSFFTGGGSKDVNGIQDGPWLYDTVNDVVPDKNDIVNAFAALYTDNDDHPVIYFGLDTLSVNGDSNAGFWFFRDDVGLNPLGPGETTGTFFGEHTDGDIFVAVAYTEGGKVGDIDVYLWVGDDATGSLVLQASGESCATAAANDDVCGVINKLLPGVTFGEDPSFDYANTLVANNPLDATSYQYESGALVEFGLDLHPLFPNGLGCFSTFMAETRSSQSTNAQLKDFAMGAFDVCSIEVIKTGDELSKVGDDASYTITITNTGMATLYKQSISDTLLGDLTDGTNAYIDASDCGDSLAAGASCTITATRTVQAGDDDPLPNTVSILYTEFADADSLEFGDSDDHEVNLFQPSVSVSKTGDALSKVGDDVDYTIEITNTSSDDTPNLIGGSVQDTLLGDLLDGANPYVTSSDCSATLATGESCTITATRTVDAEDPDPLPNTVTVSYNPEGFDNEISDEDGHEVDLFQLGLVVDKSGDELSKVGDDVNYVITISNNGSASSPDLTNGSITDTLLGDLLDEANSYVTASTCSATLPAGESCTINATRTVEEGDEDPLPNTVTASYSIEGYENEIADSDAHEVNLFQPSVEVIKTGDELSKVGDDVDYMIIINNTSSEDTPHFVNGSVQDTLLGNLLDGANPYVTGSNCGEGLAAGASCTINATRTVEEGDEDPLPNTVTVSYEFEDFENEISDSDSHSVNLFQPAIDVAKTGDELSKVGDEVEYLITLSNNSSEDTPTLHCTVEDSLLGPVYAGPLPQDGLAISLARVVEADDPDPLVNAVYMQCVIEGFVNVLEADDDHSTNLFQPSVQIIKDGDNLSKLGDEVTYNFVINNTSSDDSPDLILAQISDTVLGDLAVAAGAGGCNVLSSGGGCQFDVPYVIQPGDISGPEGNPDPLMNIVNALYHPEGFPNDVAASDDHSTELFEPRYEVEFSCAPDTVIAGQDITWTATIHNLSSPDTPTLVPSEDQRSITWASPLGPVPVAVHSADPLPLLGPGQSEQVSFSGTTLGAGAQTGTWLMEYAVTGFANRLQAEVSDTCNALPGTGFFSIEKRLLEQYDPNLNFNFDVYVGGVFQGTIGLDPQLLNPEKLASPIPPLADFDEAIDGFDRLDSLFAVETATINDVTEVRIVEQAVAGVRHVGIQCDGGSPAIVDNLRQVTIQVGHEDEITCRWTNEELGRLIVDKVTNPDTALDPEFGFQVQGPYGYNQLFALADDTQPWDSGYIRAGSGYSADEIGIPPDWDLTEASCDDSSPVNDIDISPGETVTCTFYNTERGMAMVNKTVSGVAPGTEVFTFEIRVDASVGGLGNAVATATATSANWTDVMFSCTAYGINNALCTDVAGAAKLRTDNGGAYQFCETNMMPGWSNVQTDSNGVPLDPQNWFVPGGGDPEADNSVECIAFVLEPGETEEFYVDDIPPPGGDARTIGFWKNWTSCDGHGRQYEKYLEDPEQFTILDANLPITLYEGFTLGTEGTIPDEDCSIVVSLLDKRDVQNGKKRAGDAAYGLAAQYVAYLLNINAGAASCAAADEAAADAAALLADIGFDGSGSYLKRNSDDRTTATNLAGILDSYNNNELCP